MEDRIIGPSGSKRRQRFWMLSSLVAVLALAFAVNSFAVSEESGFEDDDGNLAPDAAGLNFDWNSFAPTTWTGTAPNRVSAKTVAPWSFDGIEDAQVTTSDNAFAGGTKQDEECASVITQKAPNKDDLKRVYFASGTVNGHVYLNLAWIRIPQNTTSPSAHIAFEFNQSEEGCPAGSDGLKVRTPGDMLIVYDFEGGATDDPAIRLSRWITEAGPAPDGTCEVGSHDPADGCWNTADTLGPGVAEARVNTSAVGPVQDNIQPLPAQNPLGLNEFGEAGIDLTDALDLDEDACIAFGNAFAVSRTSGSSSTAQMKDLVGPGNVDIRNCGSVIIRKVTVPSPDPTDTTFAYTATGGLDPAEFDLKDGENQDYGDEVQAGSYSVAETDPGPNFVLTDIDCSASSTDNGTTIDTTTTPLTVSFNLAAEDTVDCTFTNTLQRGALKIVKNSTKGGAVSEPGAVFSYDGASVTDNGAGDEDPTVGEMCVSGLVPGDYTVDETSPPPGYGDSATSPQTATVANGTNCTDNEPTGTGVVTFTNPPLADIQVNFRDGGSGETSATSIVCDNTGTTPDTTPASGWDDSVTHEDIPIDPSPRTVTCTIVIDP